jgi:hypothetical protein
LQLVAALIVCGHASAQWVTSPNQSLVVSATPTNQCRGPLVLTTPDGGCYVSWFADGKGLYLQRLDAGGRESWVHGGLLVDGHPLLVTEADYGFAVASNGDALLAVPERHSSLNTEVMVFRVSEHGQQRWGSSGINVSLNSGLDFHPRVIEASDGHVVVVWNDAVFPLKVQRFSPAGVPQFAAGGIPVALSPLPHAGFPELVAAENGSVIVSGVAGDVSMQSQVGLHKILSSGASAWPSSVLVYDGGGANGPFGYRPHPVGDGLGGAALTWHVWIGGAWRSFVQRVDAAGHEVFPHNGVPVATTAATSQLDPKIAFDAQTLETFVFWTNYPAGTTQYSIRAQKITASGSRAFTDAGVPLSPTNAPLTYPIACAPSANGATVVYVESDTSAVLGSIRAARVDGAGNAVWASSPVVVSQSSDYSDEIDCAAANDGGTRVVWLRNIPGSREVQAQNVNADGSLGFPPPTSYCTAGTSATGCAALLASQGVPSSSSATPFHLLLSNADASYEVIFFYGVSGPIAHPWAGSSGSMCVRARLQRTPVQISSGSGSCSGASSLDWNAYVASHPTSIGAPFALGTTVYSQAWIRDPISGYGAVLSNALRFVLGP